MIVKTYTDGTNNNVMRHGVIVEADFGGGRKWVRQRDFDYGWLIGGDGQTYGYPLTLEEAGRWVTPSWPPGAATA